MLHINWKMEKFVCKIVHYSRSYNRGFPKLGRMVRLSDVKVLKQMKLSRYLLIVLMLVAPAFCQEPTASSLAQKVDHYYDHLHSLKVHFAETYAGIGTSRTEEGTLLLSKPSEMRWDYEQPTRKLFLIDGKFAYFYVLGDNKAEKIEAKKLDDLRSP